MSTAGLENLISKAVLYDEMDDYETTKKEYQAPGNNSLNGGEFEDNSTIDRNFNVLPLIYDDLLNCTMLIVKILKFLYKIFGIRVY